MMKAKEMGMKVDGRSPEMKSFLEELKQMEFKAMNESADASLICCSEDSYEAKIPPLRYWGIMWVWAEARLERTSSEATVKLRIQDETRHTVAEGNGPVSALDHALRKA